MSVPVPLLSRICSLCAYLCYFLFGKVAGILLTCIYVVLVLLKVYVYLSWDVPELVCIRVCILSFDMLECSFLCIWVCV